MDRAAVEKLLKENKLKVTKTRVEVMMLLKNTPTHPSAEMIMKELKDQGLSISFASVYNILEIFYYNGLIRKMKDENNVMRFDGNTDFHLHFIDEKTHDIKDFFDEELTDIFKKKLNNLKKEKNIDAKSVTVLINI